MHCIQISYAGIRLLSHAAHRLEAEDGERWDSLSKTDFYSFLPE